jgi:hypothetical protein
VDGRHSPLLASSTKPLGHEAIAGAAGPTDNPAIAIAIGAAAIVKAKPPANTRRRVVLEIVEAVIAVLSVGLARGGCHVRDSSLPGSQMFHRLSIASLRYLSPTCVEAK